jgi:hypothetical protein
MLAPMNGLRVTPRFDIGADRLHGCTPWFARMLWLFSFGRCVTVNRRLSHVIISTRQLWLWRQVRVIRFDQVSHIVYRAQAIPSLNLWRYVSLDDSDTSDSAFFLISLALKDGNSELPLFTVWEQQPRSSDWLDRLAGTRANEQEIGDEAAGAVVDLLRKYIGVPIAGH